MDDIINGSFTIDIMFELSEPPSTLPVHTFCMVTIGVFSFTAVNDFILYKHTNWQRTFSFVPKRIQRAC